MIQPVYQNGLRVESISPASGSLGSSVYTLIQLTFNSDLNTGSITNNIAVFEDAQGRYVDITSIRENPALFPVVKGTYTYKDRVITFTPDAQLKNSTKYIAAVKAGGVTDIYGHSMVAEQYFHFVTESDDVEAKVRITSPLPGQVSSDVPEIQWTTAGSEGYHVEISKQQTFETTLYADMSRKEPGMSSAPNFLLPLIELEDGMFYIRVRALKGLWSEPVQIFIKRVTTAVTSEEDLSDIIHQLSIDESSLELLEVFPEENGANLPLNLEMCYFKFRGHIDFSQLDLFGTLVERTPMDGDSGIPEEVPGGWIHVYDSREDATYLIYQIEK